MVNRTVRASVSGVDPDQVFKSVRACNGFLSWNGEGRALYQLRLSTVEVHDDGDSAVLIVQDATKVAVLDTVVRLGFCADDAVVTTTEPAS